MKLRILFLNLIALLLLTNILIASPSQIEKAENAYKTENYELALTTYKELLTKYPNDSDLLYNTANSYFKLNSMGYAIAYYLKALKLNPNNPDYVYNLNLAKKFIQNDEGELKKTLFSKLFLLITKVKLSTFVILFLISSAILLSFLFLLLAKKRKKELYTNILSVSIVLLVITGLCLMVKINANKITQGVIISKKVAAHAGPSKKLSTLFYIHEGKVCEIKSQDGNWSEIKLSNGFIGWVQTNSILLID